MGYRTAMEQQQPPFDVQHHSGAHGFSCLVLGVDWPTKQEWRDNPSKWHAAQMQKGMLPSYFLKKATKITECYFW